MPMTLPAATLAALTRETEEDLPCQYDDCGDAKEQEWEHWPECTAHRRPVVLAHRIADAERIAALEAEVAELEAIIRKLSVGGAL